MNNNQILKKYFKIFLKFIPWVFLYVFLVIAAFGIIQTLEPAIEGVRKLDKMMGDSLYSEKTIIVYDEMYNEIERYTGEYKVYAKPGKVTLYDKSGNVTVLLGENIKVQSKENKPDV